MTNGQSLPEKMRAGRLVRPARISFAFAAALAAMLGQPARAGQADASPSAVNWQLASAHIDGFYADRGGRPLWIGDMRDGEQAAGILLDYLRTADADGLDPARYDIPRLEAALNDARDGSRRAALMADRMLSEAFVAYANDLKTRPVPGMTFVDATLRPALTRPRALLEEAAAAPSLAAWLGEMGWMNPHYAGLRRALVESPSSPADRATLQLNLERARALPAGTGRYILVNAAAARLTMFEDGRPVDSMRVVIGKPKNPTPMMAALIRYTALNPYWNVPTDLAAERVAPNVVKEGLSYLADKGYEVLSDWSDQASLVDPATIDWRAVAAGRTEVRIRQRPGSSNAMGTMKFMFPNEQGIYLHDTPQKELLAEASRMFSGGCVRLEDAPRLARWLYGWPLQANDGKPELRVDLPRPIPVYITYLTIVPEDGRLASYPDVYGRDRSQLAMAAGGIVSSR